MNKEIQKELNACRVAVCRLNKKISELENRINVLQELAQKENEEIGVDAEMHARVQIALEKVKKRRGLKY